MCKNAFCESFFVYHYDIICVTKERKKKGFFRRKLFFHAATAIATIIATKHESRGRGLCSLLSSIFYSSFFACYRYCSMKDSIGKNTPPLSLSFFSYSISWGTNNHQRVQLYHSFKLKTCLSNVQNIHEKKCDGLWNVKQLSWNFNRTCYESNFLSGLSWNERKLSACDRILLSLAIFSLCTQCLLNLLVTPPALCVKMTLSTKLLFCLWVS